MTAITLAALNSVLNTRISGSVSVGEDHLNDMCMECSPKKCIHT
jgi:hypothetical protein